MAFLLSGSLGVETSEVMGTGDARKGNQLYEDRFDIIEPADELILFSNPAINVDDPDFRTPVDNLVAELRTYEGVDSVVSYYDTNDVSMVSADRHVLIARLAFKPAESEQIEKWVEPVMDAVSDANDSTAGFEIDMLGGTSGNVAMNELVDSEFGTILMVALLGGFIVMVLAFGSIVAAVVPLIMALASVFAAVGVATLVSRIEPLNIYYYEMIVLIGLAVGVDYSLFIINRFREERSAGHPKMAAIQVASSTTGRAVFYAGITVVISVSGLLLTGDALFYGLGLGAMIVVLLSVIASVTFLPALISVLGDNLNRLRIPKLGRPSSGGGIWGAITDRVLARPVVFAGIILALLLAMAVPLFSLHIGETPLSSDTLPSKLRGYRALELLEEHFGGISEMSALYVIIDPGEDGNVDTPETQNSVGSLITAVGEDDAFAPPFNTQINEAGNLMIVSVPVVGSEDEDVSKAAVRKMRDDIIPVSFEGTSVDVLVSGQAAYTVDAGDNVKAKAPIVFAFVLGMAFLILLLMFRSIIIPIKAILLNLISVGAAYGILVMVFQWGFGESILNFHAVGIIEIFMPLFLFAVLFGLSMDYHMLLLSRIREAYDSGHSNEESVSIGIKSTAALITSAAAIMVIVFGAFALSSAMFMKQMGVGLGVAVLIDATLIRAVLLPASMKLLGDRNWYLPSWLEWLPRISAEGEVAFHTVTPKKVEE
ncbi:MMPL family transporter [Chloroflexota bacterium]